MTWFVFARMLYGLCFIADISTQKPFQDEVKMLRTHFANEQSVGSIRNSHEQEHLYWNTIITCIWPTTITLYANQLKLLDNRINIRSLKHCPSKHWILLFDSFVFKTFFTFFFTLELEMLLLYFFFNFYVNLLRTWSLDREYKDVYGTDDIVFSSFWLVRILFDM